MNLFEGLEMAERPCLLTSLCYFRHCASVLVMPEEEDTLTAHLLPHLFDLREPWWIHAAPVDRLFAHFHLPQEQISVLSRKLFASPI